MIERPDLLAPSRLRVGCRRTPPLFLVVAAMMVTGGQAVAAAAGPPRLDMAGMCEATVAATPPDPRLDECVAAEQRALAYLQAAYSNVPPRVRDRCERLSRKRSMGFGSYAFIQGCLDLK